jgi:DNA gyrase/topoisomerase IV subunit A
LKDSNYPIFRQELLLKRLRQLTGLEQDKLRTEYEEIMKVIERLRALLADVNLRVALIKEELIEIRENTEMSVVQ